MADMNRCMDCGWTECADSSGLKNRRKCPECGAPFQNRHVERIFNTSGSDTSVTEEDIENAESVSVQELLEEKNAER